MCTILIEQSVMLMAHTWGEGVFPIRTPLVGAWLPSCSISCVQGSEPAVNQLQGRKMLLRKECVWAIW